MLHPNDVLEQHMLNEFGNVSWENGVAVSTYRVHPADFEQMCEKLEADMRYEYGIPVSAGYEVIIRAEILEPEDRDL